MTRFQALTKLMDAGFRFDAAIWVVDGLLKECAKAITLTVQDRDSMFELAVSTVAGRVMDPPRWITVGMESAKWAMEELGNRQPIAPSPPSPFRKKRLNAKVKARPKK